jgi:hypothetical protein
VSADKCPVSGQVSGAFLGNLLRIGWVGVVRRNAALVCVGGVLASARYPGEIGGCVRRSLVYECHRNL